MLAKIILPIKYEQKLIIMSKRMKKINFINDSLHKIVSSIDQIRNIILKLSNKL